MPITLFVAAAVGTVVFGIYITLIADQLAARTRLGTVFVGALFLGALTSIGEIGTSVTAALQGHAELAVHNAVGSIAAQTAFIAVADFMYRGVNLEHAAASASNLMLTGVLIALLSLLLLAASTPSVAWFSVHPVSYLMIAAYLFGMRLVARCGEIPMWQARWTPDTIIGRAEVVSAEGPLAWLWLRFLLIGFALAASGAVLAKSGIAITRLTGLSETFVGTLLTGVVSSMPELITAVTAIRIGAPTLAIANIVGGNVFDTMIVAGSDAVFRAGSIFAGLGSSLITLLSVTLLMNAVLLLGLLRRERHGLGNIGLEGVLLLALYGGLVWWLAV